jgi:hypothetical protein
MTLSNLTLNRYVFAIAATISSSTPALFGQFLSEHLRYHSITPCRVMDTRLSTSLNGDVRPVPLVGTCGIPATARAYAVNVTLVPVGGGAASVTLWPAGQTKLPNTETLNNTAGRIIANNAIIPASNTGAVSIQSVGLTDAIVDVNGYFAVPQEANGLVYVPLSPIACRVVDTRNVTYPGTQPIGGPSIAANTSRSFPIRTNARCPLPNSPFFLTPQAYVLNVTVIPKGPSLGFVTVFPSDVVRPTVSLLNALDGRIVANGGIFKAAANGDISVYATDAADVLIDITGYFIPLGGPGLLYTTINPCSAVDTNVAGTPATVANTPQSWGLANGCNGTATLPIFSNSVATNTTVTPQPGGLGYLTLWDPDTQQPITSLLNALDGQVTSNGAIVGAALPSGGPGPRVNTFLTNPLARLTITAYGYFL